MSTLQVNTISESTSASGVTIDGVLIKDGLVDGKDVSETGLTLVNKTTFTDSSTVTIDNVFTSSYANYRINLDIEITDGGSSTIGKMGFRTGGGSGSAHTTSSLYHQQYQYMPLGASTADTHSGQNANDFMQLGSFGNVDTYYNIEIGNPQVAKSTHCLWKGTLLQSGTDWAYAGVGIVGNNDIITGVTFYSTDNSTVSGIVYIYGYGQ